MVITEDSRLYKCSSYYHSSDFFHSNTTFLTLSKSKRKMSCDETCSCNKRGIDYYGVLSLKKDCDDLEIKAAFRRLTIRYNPKRAKDESLGTIFALIAEAYDVLSDPLKRTIYDQFGEEGLKNGVPGAEGFIQPYIYHGEPMKTYRFFLEELRR